MLQNTNHEAMQARNQVRMQCNHRSEHVYMTYKTKARHETKSPKSKWQSEHVVEHIGVVNQICNESITTQIHSQVYTQTEPQSNISKHHQTKPNWRMIKTRTEPITSYHSHSNINQN